MVASKAVQSEALKKAFLSVAREKFFPEGMREHSYVNSAFPIGSGQTISQPSTVAEMLEMLAVQRGMKVLEVGAGSGYVVALLCELVGEKGKVFGMELNERLKEMATENLATAGEKNFEIAFGDGTMGWEENAPFDRIIISAACYKIPKPLVEQLAEGGRLVAPVGSSLSQKLVLFQKENGEIIKTRHAGLFAFVPLKEKHEV